MLEGKVIKANDLIKNQDTEEALKRIDSLSRQVDIGLSKKEALEYQLELQLLRARVYDENFDQEHAIVVLLPVLDQSINQKFHKITARVYLQLVAVKYKGNDIEESEKYLKLAYNAIRQYRFDELYGMYYYHKAALYRFKNEFDAVIENAGKALTYGEQYHNEEDIALVYTMLGIGYGGKNEFKKAIGYYNKVIPFYKKTRNYTFLGMMYRNISRTYFRDNKIDSSFKYIDSAYIYYDKMSYFYREQLPLHRVDLYTHVGKWDSAVYYMSDFHNLSMSNLVKRESSKIKGITEQYENEKKEAVIKSRNQQIIFIVSLLGVIVLGTILLFRRNRQINKQNRIISTQLGELTKTLEQKQVLLSELQHRVKNNLQHVISILEIQKESVDFNNIEELIRGNQNRIHSMALLHKKLNLTDNADVVDLKRYVTDLSELVKESYDHHRKKISLHIKCEVETISIEKALPIGLILTELVSNSMKHAFKKRNIGVISIEITQEELIKLLYADNGDGFDFNKTSEKGLGQEIIKGLIDQLDGIITTNSDNGFELSICFARDTE
ncbi:Histidine kinase [compost metagenome]